MLEEGPIYKRVELINGEPQVQKLKRSVSKLGYPWISKHIYTLLFIYFFWQCQAGKSTIRQMHNWIPIQATREIYTEKKTISICNEGTDQMSKLDGWESTYSHLIPFFCKVLFHQKAPVSVQFTKTSLIGWFIVKWLPLAYYLQRLNCLYSL